MKEYFIIQWDMPLPLNKRGKMHPDLQNKSRELTDDLFSCRRIEPNDYLMQGVIGEKVELLDWLPVCGIPVFSEKLKCFLEIYEADVNWIEFNISSNTAHRVKYYLCNLLCIGDILKEDACSIDYRIPLGDNIFVFDADKPDFGKPFLSVKYWGYWFIRRDIALEMKKRKFSGFEIVGL